MTNMGGLVGDALMSHIIADFSKKAVFFCVLTFYLTFISSIRPKVVSCFAGAYCFWV